jgi:hypothetical protein
MRLLAVASVMMLLLVGMVGLTQAAGPVTTVSGVSAEASATLPLPQGGHWAPYYSSMHTAPAPETVSPMDESGEITAGT